MKWLFWVANQRVLETAKALQSDLKRLGKG